MSTLASLRDRDNPMEPDRARAIGQVASVLIDSARVEVDYIKATHGEKSDFLQVSEPSQEESPRLTQGAHRPFGVTQHRLQG